MTPEQATRKPRRNAARPLVWPCHGLPSFYICYLKHRPESPDAAGSCSPFVDRGCKQNSGHPGNSCRGRDEKLSLQSPLPPPYLAVRRCSARVAFAYMAFLWGNCAEEILSTNRPPRHAGARHLQLRRRLRHCGEGIHLTRCSNPP